MREVDVARRLAVTLGLLNGLAWGLGLLLVIVAWGIRGGPSGWSKPIQGELVPETSRWLVDTATVVSVVPVVLVVWFLRRERFPIHLLVAVIAIAGVLVGETIGAAVYSDDYVLDGLALLTHYTSAPVVMVIYAVLTFWTGRGLSRLFVKVGRGPNAHSGSEPAGQAVSSETSSPSTSR